MSRDIHFVFAGRFERTLRPGQWTWTVHNNLVVPVTLCSSCGEFTRWANGKITAKGWLCGEGGCARWDRGCPMGGRVRFLGWHTPPS
jgi:hypothetical protein